MVDAMKREAHDDGSGQHPEKKPDVEFSFHECRNRSRIGLPKSCLRSCETYLVSFIPNPVANAAPCTLFLPLTSIQRLDFHSFCDRHVHRLGERVYMVSTIVFSGVAAQSLPTA